MPMCATCALPTGRTRSTTWWSAAPKSRSTSPDETNVEGLPRARPKESQMTETILYGYWRSSATYRTRIALNLKGVAYRTVGVHLLKDENNSPEHLARHPSGRVPILEIDGRRIGQSM